MLACSQRFIVRCKLRHEANTPSARVLYFHIWRARSSQRGPHEWFAPRKESRCTCHLSIRSICCYCQQPVHQHQHLHPPDEHPSAGAVASHSLRTVHNAVRLTQPAEPAASITHVVFRLWREAPPCTGPLGPNTRGARCVNCVRQSGLGSGALLLVSFVPTASCHHP